MTDTRDDLKAAVERAGNYVAHFDERLPTEDDLDAIRAVVAAARAYNSPECQKMVEAAKCAMGDIIAERQRQIDAEGYTLAHDDAHTSGEIAEAAACWAQRGQYPVFFSWARNKRAHPRRRQLVIAGALIVAEIERLDRSAALALGASEAEG